MGSTQLVALHPAMTVPVPGAKSVFLIFDPPFRCWGPFYYFCQVERLKTGSLDRPWACACPASGLRPNPQSVVKVPQLLRAVRRSRRLRRTRNAFGSKNMDVMKNKLAPNGPQEWSPEDFGTAK